MTERISASEVDDRLESLKREVRDSAARVARIRGDLASSEREWKRKAKVAHDSQLEQLRTALQADRDRIETNARELRTTASQVVRHVIERQAPVFLSETWDSACWETLEGAWSGEWLRVGSTRMSGEQIPVALPISTGVWRIHRPTTEQLSTLVQNSVLRLVCAFGPRSIRVIAYDPELRLDLAAFAGLRAVAPQSHPPSLTSAEELDESLKALRAEIADLDDRLTGAGHKGYWHALAAGHPMATREPLRVLIVANSADLDDQRSSQLEQLRRLAPGRGLLIIEEDSGPDSPAGNGVLLDPQKGRISSLPSTDWVLDTKAGDVLIRATCEELASRPQEDTAPTVDFDAILESLADPWMSDADYGVEAVIGTVDESDLVLRLRSENPPMPNALVGGAVGQGKSNLLLVLIHSLAAQYSPAEIEMVLVDLRDGVEFARLGPSRADPTWLPHVRALGLEFDPDYSLSILRWVRAQMLDRSRLLKESETTSLGAYRAKTGKTIPRLLVVIDEFQRIFDGDDEQAAIAASELDDIARTGRGFGIHIVLASQAITGIRGLATKSESIFGQFHNRVVLKNTSPESQAFLSQHNLAAATLEHRGQVVVNDSLGVVDQNVVGTVAYAKPESLQQLQLQLFRRGHGDPPRIFRASAFATWREAAREDHPRRGVSAAVGLQIDVEPDPRRVELGRAPNQALVVVGSERAIAIPVLVRAVSTAAASLERGAEIVILDGDSQEGRSSEWIENWTAYLKLRGHAVERVDRREIAERVVRLEAERERCDLVVPVALDSVDLGSPSEPDYVMPNDSLRELMKSGSLAGTWTLGWWQSKSILDEHLGYRAPSVRAWAFAGVSRDDLTDVAGHSARESSASPRFVWFDRTAGQSAERLVPFGAADLLGDADVG